MRYASNGEWKLYGFTDADWDGSSNDRKNTFGFCFCLGSTMISWSSRKKKFISLSTTKVEYIATCLACSKVVWLQILFTKLLDQVLELGIIYCDIQSYVKLSKNLVFHEKSKHIEIK